MQLTLAGAELSVGWTRRSGSNWLCPLDGILRNPFTRGQTTLSLFYYFLLWADDQKCQSNFLKRHGTAGPITVPDGKTGFFEWLGVT